MLHGFAYLVAIMDWYNRYGSPESFPTHWKPIFVCGLYRMPWHNMAALKYSTPIRALNLPARNSRAILLENEIKISMDGRGRVYDNIFVERLWRTVKYEEIYLRDYSTVSESRFHLNAYFYFLLLQHRETL